MTGYLRLFLALMVYFSHFQSSFNAITKFNIGVFSVIIFYLLAGHVVAKVYEKVFNKNIIEYYKDRFLRVYPSYLYSLTVTLIFLVFTDFGIQNYDIQKIISNLLIIPLNYFMYIPDYINVIKVDNIWWNIIPPAWSLGLELQLYLILPFLIGNKLLVYICILLSMTVFFMAKVSMIDPDIWGYRLLPGVLFVFVSGVIIQRYFYGKVSRLESLLFISIFTIFVAVSMYIVFFKAYYGVYTLETVSGYLIGVFLLVIILRSKIKIPGETYAGFLSYAVFLNHFTGIWIYKYLGLSYSLPLAFIIILIITLLLSIPSVYIDYKIYRYRAKI